MTYGLDTRSKSDAGDAAGDVEPAAGKRTLTASFPVQRRQVQGASVQAAEASTATSEADPFAVHLPAVQRKGGGGAVDVHAAAEHGISGSSSSLPHLDAIQRSFGGHDVSGIRAHTDSAAAQGSAAMGAAGYATGNDVAFAGSSPDLHLAAHEAAHVVQQRAGVQLSGGVGEVGDVHERHADQVADAVVAGQSAEHLLGNLPSNTSAATTQRSIQSKPAAAAPAAA